MVMHLMQAIVLMEQIMEMLKVMYEATLLSASLNFESASTIEPWAYVSPCLMIIVCHCFLLLMRRRSMMFVVAAEGAVVRMVRSRLLVMVVSTPNFRSTCRFSKIVMTSINIKVVIKGTKL
jgi:hypothetical protein